jgi:foldase protein PrsA
MSVPAARCAKTASSRSLLRAMRTIATLGIAGLIVVIASGCGGGSHGVVAAGHGVAATGHGVATASHYVVAARIGGEPLSTAELSHWVSVDTAVGGGSAGSETPSKSRVLDFLISSRWLLGEARELGMHVSDGEAVKQLELLQFDQVEGRPYQGLPRDPELRRLLLSRTVGSADRLWLMRLSMLAGQIEQRYLARAAREVPRAAVARYYRRNKRRYFQPQWRDLEILTSYDRSRVVRAKREIESGTPFVNVALRMPEPDPEAPAGLQYLVAGREEREFEEVIFAAKPHRLVGPAKLAYYYLFEVLDGGPAHQQTLAEAEEKIRRRLALRQAAIKLLPTFEAKWIAQTDCRPRYVVRKCREYRGPRASEAPPMLDP